MAVQEQQGGTWEYQRQHYNSHVTNLSTREALQQRNEGPAQELKHFHNHVKRQLLWRFCWKANRLLDMCCGRGGDLHKWKDCQVKYVKGLDISEREVEEARRRHAELVAKRRGAPLDAEFEAVDYLGERAWSDPPGPGGAPPPAYDAATCMFALHYFFVSEDSLRTFLQNVAANLRSGGFFIGTVPLGPRVEELLGNQPELRTPMLRLVKRWKDPSPSPFGRGYICDIADTVTSANDASVGSLEFLVCPQVLVALAAEVGLHPVCDWTDPVLMSNFVEDDMDAPLKRFKPFFPSSLQLDAQPGKRPPQPPSSLELASSLFSAFVFQKTPGPESITLPVVPDCSYMQAPGGGGRGGGMRGGQQGGGEWGGGGGEEWGGGGGGGYGHPGHGGYGGGGGGGAPYGYPGHGGGGGMKRGPPDGGGYGHGHGDPNKRPNYGPPGGGGGAYG